VSRIRRQQAARTSTSGWDGVEIPEESRFTSLATHDERFELARNAMTRFTILEADATAVDADVLLVRFLRDFSGRVAAA
jgi:hypothetical protein